MITVGALETYRVLTNIFATNQTILTNEFDGTTQTNIEFTYPFAASTDSSNQIAAFSSRGSNGANQSYSGNAERSRK